MPAQEPRVPLDRRVVVALGVQRTHSRPTSCISISAGLSRLVEGIAETSSTAPTSGTSSVRRLLMPDGVVRRQLIDHAGQEFADLLGRLVVLPCVTTRFPAASIGRVEVPASTITSPACNPIAAAKPRGTTEATAHEPSARFRNVPPRPGRVSDPARG